uniref:Uncharacterized protein n=1 Tax=Moniliophthora roreri TaxID=221103 RepID=A0A0W0FAK5_MONRR
MITDCLLVRKRGFQSVEVSLGSAIRHIKGTIEIQIILQTITLTLPILTRPLTIRKIIMYQATSTKQDLRSRAINTVKQVVQAPKIQESKPSETLKQLKRKYQERAAKNGSAAIPAECRVCFA